MSASKILNPGRARWRTPALRTRPADERGLPGMKRGDRLEAAAIFVADRKAVEEIFDGHEAGVGESAARRGPTPFKNCSGVASRSSPSENNPLPAFYYAPSAQPPRLPVALTAAHQQIELTPLDSLFEDAPARRAIRSLNARAELRADAVLVAAGAWTPALLPHLSGVMWTVGQPVVHLTVERAAEWQAPRFPVWAADISRTGWYGFPALRMER